MKRIMVLILTIVMICALSACGKKTVEPEPEQEPKNDMVQAMYFEKDADYDGDQATLFIRKKAGEDPDISGDYNEYSQTVSAGIGGHDVTLKGDDDLINVALWTADGYSYSIDTDQALTQEQMTAIIEIVE